VPCRLALNLAAQQLHPGTDHNVDTHLGVHGLKQILNRFQRCRQVGIPTANDFNPFHPQRMTHAIPHRLRLTAIGRLVQNLYRRIGRLHPPQHVKRIVLAPVIDEYKLDFRMAGGIRQKSGRIETGRFVIAGDDNRTSPSRSAHYFHRNTVCPSQGRQVRTAPRITGAGSFVPRTGDLQPSIISPARSAGNCNSAASPIANRPPPSA
jgi:hypothetical protein